MFPEWYFHLEQRAVNQVVLKKQAGVEQAAEELTPHLLCPSLPWLQGASPVPQPLCAVAAGRDTSVLVALTFVH